MGYDFINIKCENFMSEWNVMVKEFGQVCWVVEFYCEKKGFWFRNDKFYFQLKQVVCCIFGIRISGESFEGGNGRDGFGLLCSQSVIFRYCNILYIIV